MTTTPTGSSAVVLDDLGSSDPDAPGGETAGSQRRKQRTPIGWYLASGWLLAVFLGAILAPLIPGLPDPDLPDYGAAFSGITPSHWLGADNLGRDLLSRSIYGARVSLFIGICAVGLGALVGGILGMLAGYFGGKVDRFFSLITDIVLAFPGLVLLIAIVAILGASLTNLTIGLAILSVPTFIRLSRATTLLVSKREFVQAARAYGSKPFRIIAREITPNVVLPVAAYAFILIGIFIVVEGGLSFLGLGVPPPTPSWGGMIAYGRPYLTDYPHVSLFPSAFMFLTVLSINYIGERIRKQFEVKESNL